MSPPCELFITEDQLDQMEAFYPLHVRVCSSCLLVQLPAYIPASEIFSDYAYFSSYSDSWVDHAGRFVDHAVSRLGLDEDSFVVEVASNDGYLLQHTIARGIRSLGIEPAANVAEAALARGVPTEVRFFGAETGQDVTKRHGAADLVVANNVFAHVPDIVDFAKGLRALVSDTGYVSIEIPHLLRLVESREYDTIYHEHFSYLSLLTTQRVLAKAGLTVVDVDELTTHGGSLRTWSTPIEKADPNLPPWWPRCSLTKQRRAFTASKATRGSGQPSQRSATISSSSSLTVLARAPPLPVTEHRAKGIRFSITAGSDQTWLSTPSTEIPSSMASSCPGLTFRFTQSNISRKQSLSTY